MRETEIAKTCQAAGEGINIAANHTGEALVHAGTEVAKTCQAAGEGINIAANHTVEAFAHAGTEIAKTCQAVGEGITRSVQSVDPAEMMRNAKLVVRVVTAVGHEGFADIDWKGLPRKIWKWIQAHPFQTAFIVLGLTMLVAPYVFFTPVLGLLGFTAAGPTGMEKLLWPLGFCLENVADLCSGFAAMLMSIFGPISAGSIYAILQSAAMAGYGAAILAGIVQVMAVVGLVAWMSVLAMLKTRQATAFISAYGSKEMDKEN